MTGRTLRFVERAPRRRPPDGGPTVDVVLDTWWTPRPADPPDVVPLRPVIERILAGPDLVNGSLDRLDEWATATGMADRFVVDGVTWWFKVRMGVRWDLHEMMIWQGVLSELAPPGRYETIEIPWRRTALVAAARARSAGDSGRPRILIRHSRLDLRDLYQRARRTAGQSWRVRRAIGADTLGYVSVDGNSVTRPSLAVTSLGKVVLGASLIGPDYFPSSAYTTFDDSATSAPTTLHVAAAATVPADGFTGYRLYGGNGVERWGDYGFAAADGESVWVANEWIPGLNQGPDLAGWGTYVSKITP